MVRRLHRLNGGMEHWEEKMMVSITVDSAYTEWHFWNRTTNTKGWAHLG